ncbi:MAG: hypothetical protein KGL53_03745, partial [Elusimicrobia bacterium]|nr:hypothetical protein [Elusimicrobiota bacterium]
MAHNVAAAAALWGRTLTPTGRSDVLAAAVGAALAAAAAVGLAANLRRKAEAWSLFLAGSALLHLFWPWWYERYLAALLPFCLLAAWEGARAAGLRRRTLAWAAAALAVIPLPVQGWAVAERARSVTPALAQTYAWMRNNLPPDGLVASVQFPRDAWYCGRPFAPLPLDPAQGSPADLARGRIRFVLWVTPPDYGSSLGRSFRPARELAAWPALLSGPGFRLLHAGADGGEVFEVAAPGADNR